MGRGKLVMELIQNQKARKLAMEKRKMNLKKKAHELSTLCDVPVCVLMYNPDDPEPPLPLLYPESRDEAESIISRYLSIPNASGSGIKKRRLNLEEGGGGINKRRRVGGDSESPSLMSGLSRDQLLDMAAVLDHKLQFVQARIAAFGQSNANLIDQIGGGGINPDLGLIMSDQETGLCDQEEQGFWSANCYDQQQLQQQYEEPGLYDQELGMWSANCCDQQQQQQEEQYEDAMVYSGPQFCSADQLMGGSTSSSGLEAVLGFQPIGITNFYS